MIYDEEKEIPVGLRTLKGGEFTLSEIRDEFSMDIGSIVANPEFVDIKNYDFRLKKTSPAYNIGFKDIDISDVGCKKKIKL